MSSMFLNALLAQQGSAVDTIETLAQGRANPVRTSKVGASPSLDFDNPRDNLYAFGKIWAGYDGPEIGAFHGLMYARIDDKRLIPLFGYTGTGCMESRIDENGNMVIRGRETGYFTDLATGDILKTWQNPFT